MDERSTHPSQSLRTGDLSGSDTESIGGRLCSDLVQRWQRGERVPVEAYLRLHPELQKADDLFELVLTEVALRQTAGEPAALEEYRFRFPQFDARLERHFANWAVAAWGLSTPHATRSSAGRWP
jgi:hypothetical protein